MNHKMGVAEIELKTATYYAIVEANNGTSTITRTSNTNEEVTASSSFSTASPYHLPVRKGTTSLYYAVVPTGTNSTQFNSTTGSDQWSSVVTATEISSGAVGHYDAYSTRVGTSTYSGSFSCSGTYLTFTVPFTGTYTIECWGAQGGDTQNNGLGGKGGYVKGTISLNLSDVLYIYIGNKPSSDNTYHTAAKYYATDGNSTHYDTGVSLFNGGGAATCTTTIETCCGGGATDVRIMKHTESDGWSGAGSLKSRIIVAGAGGGGQGYQNGSHIPTAGGAAGGLTGYNGSVSHSLNGGGTLPTGGTQTSGGVRDQHPTWTGHDGGFGFGGQGEYYWYGGGGGSGWYGGGGGGSGSYVTSGAGGSSFISGMTGCNGWDNELNNYAGAGNPSKILVGSSYKTFSFSNCEMIDGAHSMPKPDGSGNETGHAGNGYCRITGTSVVPQNKRKWDKRIKTLNNPRPF